MSASDRVLRLDRERLARNLCEHRHPMHDIVTERTGFVVSGKCVKACRDCEADTDFLLAALDAEPSAPAPAPSGKAMAEAVTDFLGAFGFQGSALCGVTDKFSELSAIEILRFAARLKRKSPAPTDEEVAAELARGDSLYSGHSVGYCVEVVEAVRAAEARARKEGERG